MKWQCADRDRVTDCSFWDGTKADLILKMANGKEWNLLIP